MFLIPPTGELLAKCPTLSRDGMDAAFAAAAEPFSSWSKLTWEARTIDPRESIRECPKRIVKSSSPPHAEGGRPREACLVGVAAVLD